jgi:NAD(P)-dependent dehydrogenase (short-subunit alcohol dehydrogenase family)
LSKDILSQSFNFEGQVALVTGSGRGLGRMIAETLLGGGAAIALHDINEEAPAAFGESPSLTALAASLSERGGAKVTSVIGDISKEEDTKAIVKKVEAALGPISILVNCAGGDIAAKGGKPNPNDALNISLEDAHAVMNRNFIGTMLMCRAVVPGMIQRQKGAVINFGSLTAISASRRKWSMAAPRRRSCITRAAWRWRCGPMACASMPSALAPPPRRDSWPPAPPIPL